MNRLKAINKNTTLSDKAYQIIKQAIIANELKPGDLLTEEKLAEQLQISRTPIKAALGRLIYEEFAYVNDNKNVVVLEVSSQDVKDITVVRISLEPVVISLLEGKITDEQIEYLENINQKQRISFENGKNEEFLALDYEFHTKLAEYTENQYLMQMVGKANLVVRRFLSLSGPGIKSNMKAIEEHEEIVKCLKNGEFSIAKEAMNEHLGNVRDRFLF
ncbi:GntR family transcriptional regulator [Candidatus Clostridium helianthi]|uniref:GntR family transcriptional regulator n=1 Tax=Candidatus Clostridium helianthi TaxID=3381660 RepID=A0ABW8S9M8_9CLOT